MRYLISRKNKMTGLVSYLCGAKVFGIADFSTDPGEAMWLNSTSVRGVRAWLATADNGEHTFKILDDPNYRPHAINWEESLYE